MAYLTAESIPEDQSDEELNAEADFEEYVNSPAFEEDRRKEREAAVLVTTASVIVARIGYISRKDYEELCAKVQAIQSTMVRPANRIVTEPLHLMQNYVR